MDYLVSVFEISRDADPKERPRPVAGFSVSASSVDEAREATVKRLAAEGRVVRSLSHTAGGIAVVVYAPTSAAPSGGR